MKASSAASLETTKADLREALKDVPGISVEFITDQLLARPPFSFVRALVRIFVRGLGFANVAGLFTDQELDPTSSVSRTEKVRLIAENLFL